MATFFRVRTFRGKEYLYKEERWRSKGKMKSRSTCLGRLGGHRTDGKPAHATEAEWERHQKNERDLWLKIDSSKRAPNSFETRHRQYRASHTPFFMQAQERAAQVRVEVRAENQLLDKAERFAPKGSPTPEEEVMHANWTHNQQVESLENYEEYAPWANEQDAEKSED